MQREVEELAPLANIHDLRIVPGPTHTNVIFDCAVPAEYMTEMTTRTPTKTAIAALLKTGTAVPGCELVERVNPSVK